MFKQVTQFKNIRLNTVNLRVQTIKYLSAPTRVNSDSIFYVIKKSNMSSKKI
jgi:hypothetical protein